MEVSGSPMLSVTVMMLRLMVESVMLLKDEDWKGRRRTNSSEIVKIHQPSHLFVMLNVYINFARIYACDVSLRRSPGLFWPLCVSAVAACVCA